MSLASPWPSISWLCQYPVFQDHTVIELTDLYDILAA